MRYSVTVAGFLDREVADLLADRLRAGLVPGMTVRVDEDEHVVTFSETGYGLQHPIACRPDLMGCAYDRYLAGLDGPDDDPGRYSMVLEDGVAAYRLVEETS